MSDPWVYQQLYHEPGPDGTFTDDLLLRYAAPAVAELTRRGWIDRFFFLRYQEGGNHLRFRVRVAEAARGPAVAAFLTMAAGELGMAISARLAVYEPEWEKYGGAAGMAVAERQFHTSSRLALACIGETRGDVSRRFLAAACLFDTLLVTAGLDQAAQLQFLAAYSQYWRYVHSQSTGQAAASAAAEPTLAAGLANLLADSGGSAAAARELAGPAVEAWLAELRPDMDELASAERAGRLTVPRTLILTNLAHTFHNRLGFYLLDEVLLADLVAAAHGA